MPDARRTVHAMMRGLVASHFPTQQSAAKEIADFFAGPGGAGDQFDPADLSRKMNGTRQWTLNDAIALQALSGTDRISQAIAPEVAEAPPRETVSLLAHAGRLVKEAGEGTSALLAASEGGCRHEARAELLDIVAAAEAALVALDAPSALRATPFKRVDRA